MQQQAIEQAEDAMSDGYENSNHYGIEEETSVNNNAELINLSPTSEDVGMY